jgi:probable HAF family extracellular repeat protein
MTACGNADDGDGPRLRERARLQHFFRMVRGTMSNSGIAPTFEGLGFLPNGTSSDATGVSGDGSVVVGYAPGVGTTQAFSWSGGTMTPLGSLNPSTTTFSQAFGTNFNGSVVVGMSYSYASVIGPEWFSSGSSPQDDVSQTYTSYGATRHSRRVSCRAWRLCRCA